MKRSTTNGGPYTTVGTPTTTSFTDTGLTNGTIYYYVVSAVNSAGAGANSNQVFDEPGAVAPNVTIIVNPAQTQAISPYIYGIDGNTNASIPNVPAVTIFRMGGNRWTAYNWTTNASNAGSDYLLRERQFPELQHDSRICRVSVDQCQHCRGTSHPLHDADARAGIGG